MLRSVKERLAVIVKCFGCARIVQSKWLGERIGLCLRKTPESSATTILKVTLTFNFNPTGDEDGQAKDHRQDREADAEDS